MDLGIAQTAKLTVDYAAVLFWKITRQFSVTIVRCGFTMDVLSSQNLSMQLLKIQTVPGLPKMLLFQHFRIFSFFFFFLFFNERLNLENQNRFDPLTKEKKTGSSSFGISKNNFTGGLKFVSININSIRGNKLELLAFFDFHQPHIVAIQETKIATSKLFPESCPYNVYRNGALPHSRKKFIGFITHFSSWSVSGYSLTGQTQWSWYCCWNFESCPP